MKPATPSPIEHALELLWRRSRFTSYFFQSVQFRREDGIPTLALAVEQSRATLLYNESFVTGLGVDELIGLLVHEMLHVVLSHNHRAHTEEDLRLQNIAQDMTVNSYILEHRNDFFSKRGDYEAAVPRLFLPPGLPFIPSGFFRDTAIKDPAWEDVYHWLKKQPGDKLLDLIDAGADGMPSGGDDAGIASALQDALRNPLQIPLENIPVQKFSFGGTQGLAFTDRDEEVLPTGVHLFHGNRDLRALDAQRDRVISLASIDNECREERSCEEIRGIIQRAAPVDISSWKRQLRSIIDYSSQSGEWTYTYGRFNRRYFSGGVYSPGRVYKEQEIITVAVDVSASMVMKPGDIEAAFGVIEELLGKYRVHLVCIDEDLFIPVKKDGALAAGGERAAPYVYKAGDWKHLRTGSSGTTFFAPLFNDYMRGHRELLLVITDGEIYDLHLLRKYAPTVWVLPEDGRHAFQAPFGRTVKVRAGRGAGSPSE